MSVKDPEFQAVSEAQEASDQSLPDYAAAVAWITGLVAFGIRPGLTRMQLLMERLGHPERRLKFIHVAGTNGKGSTCAFLTRVLVQNGYDVGTFTSPYIEKFTDRIQYNGRSIPEEDLLRLARRVKPLAEELAAGEFGSPTMFEVSTVVALLYFATVSYPDYVVWETGLGGRLDSTNVVTPVLSVITNIGHDHMDVLGDSLELVAYEKAGIIKAGVPVVTTIEQPELLSVVEEEARRKSSTVYAVGRQFRYEPVSVELNRQVMNWEGPFRSYEEVPVGLNGLHQLKNASLALMALEVLRQYYALVLEDEDVYEGFREARWPGRLELIRQEPRILLDGAHNPEGAETLAQTLASGVYSRRKLRFLMGMLSTKNHTGYLRHILPVVDTLILTEPDYPKKLPAEALAEVVHAVAAELGVPLPELVVESDWKSALERLIERTEPEDLAVVSGTLYLISDVRAWFLGRTHSEKGW